MTEPPESPKRRDREGTRELILDAAQAEFAERGFAGARVQGIAQRSGLNVRMQYHYFGEKDALFRAVLKRRLGDRPVELDLEVPFGERLAELFKAVTANPDWIRLYQWESLEFGDDELVAEEARRGQMAEPIVRHIEESQLAGQVDPDLDSELLTLALFALASFPAAFGSMVRVVTGLSPSSPEFQGRYAKFLDQITQLLSSAAPAND